MIVKLAIQSFLIYESDKGERSASRCGRLTPQERAAGVY